jgi:hypothetical protein
MLSIPRRSTRAIRPHSHSVRRIINMSGSTPSSSAKRKRDHPGDTRPDTKAPKRAYKRIYIFSNQHASPPVGVFRLPTYSLASCCPQSFLSLKSAEREMKRPMRRISPLGGSHLPSVLREVVYTACTSLPPYLRASRRSISMVPLSSHPISK